MNRDNNSSTPLTLQLNPKRILYSLLGFFVFLLIMNFVSLGMKFTWGIEKFQAAPKLFHFDQENNVPSFFSAVCLLTSGFLLFAISWFHRKRSQPFVGWLGLALIFVFLSADEASMIHERLVDPIKRVFAVSPYFNFAWIISYGIGTLILAILYLKFLLSLPRRTLVLFVVSGILFVSGALGFEMLGGNYFEYHGANTLAYDMLCTVEESLEMLGVITFIYALLSYISAEFGVPGILVQGERE